MKSTSRQKFLGALGYVGVEAGDVLMVHSYLPSLGLMEDGPAGVIDTLLQALGPGGTLVMPTFTLRFFDEQFQSGVPFHVQRTPSEVGVIGEGFRNRPFVQRSINPIHSVAALGPRSADIIGEASISSFGPESPWGVMVRLGAKALMLGVDFQLGASFMHHVEEMMEVPYRFWKEFPGQVVVSDRIESIVYPMYVRDLAFDTDYNRVGGILEAQGIVKTCPLGYGALKAIDMKDGYQMVAGLVRLNPMICAVPAIP